MNFFRIGQIFRNIHLAVLLVWFPTFGMTAVPEIEPSDDFVGVSYSISSSGTVVVYVGARDIGGKVAVCGLVWFEKATSSTRAIEPKFTEKMTFTIAGKGLSVNSRVFSRYKTKAEAAAGMARCGVTLTPWKSVYGIASLDMDLGNATIYE